MKEDKLKLASLASTLNGVDTALVTNTCGSFQRLAARHGHLIRNSQSLSKGHVKGSCPAPD